MYFGNFGIIFFYCELINGLFVEIWCRQVVFCIFPPKKGILMREKDLSQGKPRESRLDCRIRLMGVKKPEASKLMKISFTKNRIFQAARLMSLRNPGKRVAVLNFANPVHLGG